MPKQNSFTKPATRNCKYLFVAEEILQFGRELAEHTTELKAIEEDKKRVVSDFTAKTKAKEADISIVTNKIQSGYEWRTLPCTVHYNTPKTGRKTIIRDDTQDTVAVEDMTPEELQQDLPIEA